MRHNADPSLQFAGELQICCWFAGCGFPTAPEAFQCHRKDGGQNATSDIRQLPSSPSTILKPPSVFKCLETPGPRPCSSVAFAEEVKAPSLKRVTSSFLLRALTAV